MAGERATSLVEFGPILVHAVSMPEAIDLIAERAASGRGGFVLTPNLDHLALSRHRSDFRAAYRGAFLALADGVPLVAASRMLRLPLREKVSGSDLFEPLMARCAADGLPVYFLGATESSCRTAARKLREDYPGFRLAGYDASFFDMDAAPEAARKALQLARDRGARLILVCLPPAKQLMLHVFEDDYRPALGIGLGSTLGFYAGDTRRAPRWMSRIGLEWLYRLSQEPRRLWRRYLVEDPQALLALLGMAADRVRGRSLVRTSQLDTSHLTE